MFPSQPSSPPADSEACLAGSPRRSTAQRAKEFASALLKRMCIAVLQMDVLRPDLAVWTSQSTERGCLASDVQRSKHTRRRINSFEGIITAYNTRLFSHQHSAIAVASSKYAILALSRPRNIRLTPCLRYVPSASSELLLSSEGPCCFA
jgi:hypothetical protein